MKALLASVVVYLSVIISGGESSLDGVIKAVLVAKELTKGCATATDLKCPRDDITFWLYTRSTADKPTQLTQSNLQSAPWVDGPLKFIVHGYSVNKDTAVNAVLRPAYFQKGDYNIISVDWSPLGKEGCYYHACMNVPTIAHCVAQFFSAVVKSKDFSSVQLLGHSVGGHIVEWASYEIDNLPRLTKFDPAYPLFGDDSDLHKDGKADFIDVYHSNCHLKGRPSSDGTIDVNFNSGTFQPGCGCDTGCSHLRAVQYYAESISDPEKMKAFPCDGWSDYKNDKCSVPKAEDLATVGEEVDIKKKGNYMMFTNDKSPFFVDPSVYLNESSFKSFKEKVNPSCKAFNTFESIMDWFG